MNCDMMDMQIQSGTCDCYSHSPSSWSSARRLFILTTKCDSIYTNAWKRGHLRCFHYSRKEELAATLSVQTLFQSSVHAPCLRMPRMVQCSRCAEWFHVYCVNPPQSAIDCSKPEVEWHHCNFLLTVLMLTKLYLINLPQSVIDDPEVEFCWLYPNHHNQLLRTRKFFLQFLLMLLLIKG